MTGGAHFLYIFTCHITSNITCKGHDYVVYPTLRYHTPQEHINDAETEIYIADDIKCAMGESFVQMDTDEVDTLLADTKEVTEAQLAQIVEERVCGHTPCKDDTSYLYFKSNIIFFHLSGRT